MKKISEKFTKLMITGSCKIHQFMISDDGDVNIVSIVVIIGIVILLAILFKGAITNLLNSLFNTIGNNANNAIS